MKHKLLFISLLISGLTFGQQVFYDIPFGQTIGLDMTSGDICTAPFTVEEAKQSSIGNSWGCTWTSTNGGTPTSVQVELRFSIADNPANYPTTLNGNADATVNSLAAVNCAQGSSLYWGLNPANYNVMGTNTFMVDYSSSSIINQLDNLPYAGDPFMRVTVTYAPSGIDELDNTAVEVVQITDLLGRETEFKPNTPLMYWYSDGTVKRMFTME